MKIVSENRFSWKTYFYTIASREQPLSSVVSDTFFAIFDKWREEDMKCLKAFRECKKLVDWTKASIHSKTELKTWVDLALMSTGESDIETGQILTFSEAIKGFSPVIYDLRSTEAIDFPVFVDAINEVMEGMRADPALATKLKEANRMLDRIKNISERHGDVETGSLKVLHDINATGVYTIRQEIGKGVTVTMNYEVVGDEDNIDKAMSKADLWELRSKLMLISVSEEENQNVEKFVTVLAEIETIVKHLGSLLAAGCNLFAEFTLKAFLKETSRVRVRIDFGHGGLLNSGDPVSDTLSQVARFLERANRSFDDYISQMRAVHSGLNYFTTDQLVLLSSALAGAKFEKKALSVEALSIINYVCPSVEMMDLVAILSGAEAAAHPKQESVDIEEDDDDDDEEATIRKTLSAFRGSTLFKTLTKDYNFGDVVALAALIMADGKITNEEDISAWCLENEGMSEAQLIEMARKHVRGADLQETSGAVEVKREPLITPVKGPRSKARPEFDSLSDVALIDQLNHLWNNFMRDVAELEASDNINFSELAVVLEKLVDGYSSRPQRTFPTYMQAGRPNLVSCSEADMHRTALLWYQTDEEKPLPSLDEILIVSPDTPREQVELVCRDAIQCCREIHMLWK